MSTRKLAAVLLALSATFLSALSWADSQVRIVRLSYVYGDVQVDRRDDGDFERAILNLPLRAGDRLLTKGSSRAEIEFEKGSTIRMMPGTRIEFSQLKRRDSGQPLTLMMLQEGTAYFNLHRKDGEGFGIEVRQHQIRLPKSAHFRLHVRGTRAELSVFKGKLEVAPNRASNWVAVGKKETLTLDLDDASRYFLAKGISPFGIYDEWDKEIKAHRDKSARVRSVFDEQVSSANSFTNCHWAYFYFSPASGHGWCWYPGSGYRELSVSSGGGYSPGHSYPPHPPASAGNSGGSSGQGPVGRSPNPQGGPGGRQPVIDNPEPNRPSANVSGNGNTSGGSGGYFTGSSGSGSGQSSAPSSTGRMDGGSHSSAGRDHGGSQPRANNPR